jgi:transcription initiation factor TFIID TATA-box-binding protein
MSDIKVVNIVASTTIADYIDIEKVYAKNKKAIYDPERFPGVVYRLDDPKVAMLLFRTGKVNCTGAKNIENIQKGLSHIVKLLKKTGVKVYKNPEIVIQNMVATYDLGVELKLNTIAVALGLENIEYEPEQFPGLVFRIYDPKSVMLLFSSGKVVITGANTMENLRKAVAKLEHELHMAGMLERR